MKTSIRGGILVLAVALLAPQIVLAQGFLNLNFEGATVVPAFPPSTSPISASSAIPHWTAYFGSSTNPTAGPQTTIGYDAFALDGEGVFLEDSNAPSSSPLGISLLPIQGNYSVLLQGSALAAASTASIGQTGTIPNTAQSLTFFANLGGTVQVSFSGVALSFVAISNALNYTVYGVDVSPFAGETGQLLFTAPIQNFVLLDNIQFSSSPVPEPSTVALTALGALLFGFRRRKNSVR